MQQSQYIITEASLTADRLGGFETESIDIRNLIMELSLYESIYDMCITGEITILDDKSLFDEIDFRGTEKLRIKIAGKDKDIEPVMEKTFILDSIKQENRGSNSQGVFTFSVIEEHGILATAQKLRNSYRGSISNIITKIAISYLDKFVDTSYTGQLDAIQDSIRVIIPNLNPNKAIKWLTSRATTTTGSPYFIWSTIQDNNLRFGNLDVMYSQEPWNKNFPYTYNPANVSTAEAKSELESAFIITALIPGESNNLLESIVEGHYGANQETTNLNTGQIERRHYNVLNTLNNLDREGIIKIEKQNVYDDQYRLNDIPLASYDAVNIHSILSSGVYGDYKSYHDEFDKSLLTKKLESASINNLLLKNCYHLVIPGSGFFIGKATVGDTVNVRIVNTNLEVGEQTTKDNLIDKKKSGKHLITKLRHTFRGEKHETYMQVAKLEKAI